MTGKRILPPWLLWGALITGMILGVWYNLRNPIQPKKQLTLEQEAMEWHHRRLI